MSDIVYCNFNSLPLLSVPIKLLPMGLDNLVYDIASENINKSSS